MENELQDPMGAPVPPIPAYHLSSVIYSPDCGHFLETTGPPDSTVGHHLLGLKAEVLHYHIRYWILGMATIFYGILTVTKAQFMLARTPSNVHRISVWSLLIMALADLMAFTSVTTMSLSSGRMFLPFLAAVFPCLALAGVEANFLSQVYKTQEPDRRRQFNARQRQGTATRSTPPPSSDALPRPVTDPGQTHGASRLPVIVPLDQDVDAGSGRPAHEDAGAPEVFFDTPFSTIMGWCMFGSTALLFLSIAATGWYPWVRALYANSVLFAYLSFWVPQIYRNAMRNSRRALSWHFMIGQSMLRLLPISYFYVYPSNIMFCDTDRSSFALMCAWIWVQLFVLACQDVLGSRLFIPQDWLPEAWEYHPVLKEDSAEGGGLPIGLFASPGSPGLERSGSGLEDDRKDGLDSSSRLRAIDCAICYEDVEVRVVRAGKEDASSTGVAGMLARRQYMVTPCRHIFHTACLESWMQLRLQCPICREELPPL